MSPSTPLRWAAAAALLLALLLAWLSVPQWQTPAPAPAPTARPSMPRSPPPAHPAPQAGVPLPFAVPDAAALEALTARLVATGPDLPPSGTLALLRIWVDRLRGAVDLPPLQPSSAPVTTPGPPAPARTLAPAVLDAAAALEADGVPLLVAALTDGANVLREAHSAPADTAVRLVAASPHLSTEALARLYERAEHTELRARLVEAATRRAPLDAGALILLRGALADRQPRVLYVALERVEALGEATLSLLPEVHALLAHVTPSVAQAAAATLIRLEGPAPDAVRVIDDLLGSVDPLARERGIDLVRTLGDAGRDLQPKLLPLLDDGEFVDFVHPARRPLPDRIAWKVVEALVELRARELLPALERIAREGRGRARIGAGLVLLGLEAPLPQAVQVLVEALSLDESEHTTGWLEAEALGRAATVPAERVTPALVEAVATKLATGRSETAGRALLQLGETGRARARSVLGGAGTAYERQGLLAALAGQGERARAFEDVLVTVAASDENAWNREVAARILAALAD